MRAWVGAAGAAAWVEEDEAWFDMVMEVKVLKYDETGG